MSLFKSFVTIVISAILVVGGSEACAQGSDTGVSAPESMPPEIAEMLGEMESTGAEIATAPSDQPQSLQDLEAGATAAGNRYIYTTLRVITNAAARGCGYANWNCMTQLCRSDMHDNNAWRGWAGCWKRDSWICYFECGQVRDAF